MKTQPEGEAKAHRILVERSGDELVKYDFFIQNLRSDYWVKSMGIVLLEENHRFGSTFPIEHWNVDEVYVTDGKHRNKLKIVLLNRNIFLHTKYEKLKYRRFNS